MTEPKNYSREEQERILYKYRKEVEEKKSLLSQAKGEEKVIKEQIKEEFGIEPSIEGMKKEVMKRKRELELAYDKLNEKINRLKREYPIDE